jgi:hypothetical protein
MPQASLAAAASKAAKKKANAKRKKAISAHRNANFLAQFGGPEAVSKIRASAGTKTVKVAPPLADGGVIKAGVGSAAKVIIPPHATGVQAADDTAAETEEITPRWTAVACETKASREPLLEAAQCINDGESSSAPWYLRPVEAVLHLAAEVAAAAVYVKGVVRDVATAVVGFFSGVIV